MSGLIAKNRRLHAWSVVWACGSAASGVGLVLGAVVVRVVAGPGATGWSAVFAMGAVALPFTFVVGLLSEPAVSRLTTWLTRGEGNGP